MSYGFGTIQPRDINQIVVTLEKQISEIKADYSKDYTILSNKLNSCELYLNKLKEYISVVQNYTETEYKNLQTKIDGFESEIDDLKEKLNQVNYRKIGEETVAVGISPLNDYKETGITHPFSAKYAVNDSNKNNIVETYATKDELNSIYSTLSADYTQKIEDSSSSGMFALSSVSGLLSNAIEEECQRATSTDKELSATISSVSSTISTNLDTVSAILQQNIDNEIDRATEYEQNLADKLTNEITRATNEEEILNKKITTETNRAITAEEGLSVELSAEIERAKNTDEYLKQQLDNEITARENADSILQTNIEYEATERRNKDIELENTISSVSSTLNDSIFDEYTRAFEKENYIVSELNKEIENRISAISSTKNELTKQIENEEIARINAITNEQQSRISADNILQQQIDTIEATQNVIDIVGTKSELDDYDTSKIKINDKIQVLEDETQSNATTIYNWTGTSFSIVGTLGPYYTKSELDNKIDTVSYSLTTQLNEVSGTLFNSLSTSSTNLNNTITSLSSTVDETIETLSGDIDSLFEDSYNYIEELSGTAQSQFDNLYDIKQNNLSAGDGIDITNDIVSHSIKIIENNNQEDSVLGTVFTVYLKNNHYKVITFDKTITEIIFMIEKTPVNILQETGFEFTVPENSNLETLTFRVINDNNKKIYTIIPDSYTCPNIYQGTIVNYRCTIGEYEVEN